MSAISDQFYQAALRSRGFVPVPPQELIAWRYEHAGSGLDAGAFSDPALGYFVSVSSGPTLSVAALEQLRRAHKSLLDDLDAAGDDDTKIKVAVGKHALQVRLLASIFMVATP